jgi:hypothetical protein
MFHYFNYINYTYLLFHACLIFQLRVGRKITTHHLGVSESVLFRFKSDGIDDDFGHFPVALLEVEAGGGTRLQDHGLSHALSVQAAVSDEQVSE